MKQDITQRHEIIIHRGSLTISSLDACLTGSIFRPAGSKSTKDKAKQDPLSVGWEHVPSKDSYDFIIEGLDFVTAEGVVTLATLIDCLRNHCKCKVNVKIDSKGKTWVEALHLEQLVENRWYSTFPDPPSNIGAFRCYPLWRYVVSNYKDCEKIAERLSRQAGQLLESYDLHFKGEIIPAIQLIFTEALLNVLEHAYPARQERVVFESMTVVPVPEIAQLKKLAYASAEEQLWFDHHQGRMMLEIAVSDYGKNVPSTLWKSYCKEHTEICDNITKLRLGSNSGQIARANLQHNISLWSFNHKSTRKAPNQFTSELALFNWRGLHRALNTTARLGGCMIMRSGQARTGYVFQENVSTALSAVSVKQHEFPGTSIILRIPIVKQRRPTLVPGVDAQDAEETAPVIKLKKIIKSSAAPVTAADLPQGFISFIGIAHPFRIYQEEDIKGFLSEVLSVPPQVVSFHLFVSLDSIPLIDELTAYESNEGREIGLPRLIVLWKPGGNFTWKFVGVLPEHARSLVKDLEVNGVAATGDAPPTIAFAEQLARLYAPLIKLYDGSLQLTDFGSRLSGDDTDEAMQLAFEMWAEKTKDSWLFDRPGDVIRLKTGRLVRRYISVLKTLYSNDFLAQSIGWRLASVIRNLKREAPELCIVTESEASYFIARILLQDQGDATDIYIGVPPGGHWAGRPVVAFADAINKGESLVSLLQDLKDCQGVVCCIDLRKEFGPTVSDRNIPITSLLRFPFDPQEVTPDHIPITRNFLEVDAVTHIPEEEASQESFLIGTNEDRNDFINNSPHLFRYGLHKSGGRIHVISISNREISNVHQALLLDWIEDIVKSEIGSVGAPDALKDIVFFTRNESSVKDVIEELTRRLRAFNQGTMRFFSAILPFVPSGPREIFGRPTPELFHGLQHYQVTESPELFYEAPADFLGIYLDDACVTGKSLLNFLIRICKAKADHLPAKLIAIPILSRFSPAEESFYKDVCRGVSVSEGRERSIPFSFCPLFRLQIRSFEKLQSTPVYELLSTLGSRQFWLDARLQKYVADITASLHLELSNTLRGDPDAPARQHPFYGGQDIDLMSMSGRVIRIRHLIALQEQNIGVLSQLLSELLYACSNDDDSLLTMLALEPDLINTPPLLRECRLDITNLAVRALTADGVSPAVKSDALCVLSLQGLSLIQRLPEVLPAIAGDTNLVDQFLVFLLTLVPRVRLWSGVMDDVLQSCGASLSDKEFSYIRGCVRSFDEISEPAGILTSSTARQAIRNLFSQLSLHSKGLSALNMVRNWLLKKDQDRYLTNRDDLKMMMREAIAVVRMAILPGLSGLYLWADQEHYHLNAALAFRNARFKIIINLNNVESLMETLEEGPVGGEAAERLAGLWGVILENSQISASEVFLSRPLQMPNESLPVLERWATQFFSLPFETAINLAPQFVPDISISSSWEKEEQGLSIVIVPVPLKPVRDVFRLIMEDMQKHGGSDDNSAEFFLSTGESPSLFVRFRDQVRQDDFPGTGKSQAKARLIAQEHGFRVIYDLPRKAGELYQVEVVFPDFLRVKND
jgi:hypothetical protein